MTRTKTSIGELPAIGGCPPLTWRRSARRLAIAGTPLPGNGCARGSTHRRRGAERVRPPSSRTGAALLSCGGEPERPSGHRGGHRRGDGGGVPAGAEGRLRVERRHVPVGKPDPPGAQRTLAHLDRAEGERAVLPAGVHDVLARETALGAATVRLPPRQRAAARRFGAAAVVAAAPPRPPGRVARGGAVRPPPGVRGVGGLGHRAQEHALVAPDAARGPRLPRLAGGARAGGAGTQGQEGPGCRRGTAERARCAPQRWSRSPSRFSPRPRPACCRRSCS